MEIIASQTNGVHKEANFPSGLSYFHRVGKNPLIYRTLGQQLSLVATEYSDREAFVFVEENRRLTYGQLLREADRLAAGLKCLGLKRGDRVGILAPSVPTWPIAMFAAARAGLIAVFISPTAEVEEIAQCLRKVSAKVLITAEKIGSEYYYDKLLEIIPDLCTESKRLPSLTNVIIDSEERSVGTLRVKDVMSLPSASQIGSIEEQQKDISPDSGSTILFTSGFTGSPKAVLLSHFGFINTGYYFERFGQNSTRMCLPLPCCHIYALWVTTISLCSQACVIVPNHLFNPEKTLRAVLQERCTIIYCTPKLYLELMAKQKELKLDIQNLSGVTGGIQLTPEQFIEIKKELRLNTLKVAFGMTEYSAISFAFLPESTDEPMETVGRVIDHLEVKVVDGSGNLVPLGTPGELCVRGYPTMMKYWGDEEKTREILGSDGWLRTGDCFILQPNGYGKILSRMSDIVRKGTERIFPKDIENLLTTSPRIAEAYVVGVPDEHWGEELCAFVGLRNGFETFTKKDVEEFCRGKIPDFRIPRYVQVIKDFPKTASGKVKKIELKNNFLNSRMIVN